MPPCGRHDPRGEYPKTCIANFFCEERFVFYCGISPDASGGSRNKKQNLLRNLQCRFLAEKEGLEPTIF
ncbi:MAG TPA: hypothetical protein DC042_02885 [Bacteroidales bacterium]|nr:hypothetical protein [Bacteroidales bacterium]